MAEGTAATAATIAADVVEAALKGYCSESVLLLTEHSEIVARTGHPIGPLGYLPNDPEAAMHPAEHVHPDDLMSVLEMVGRVRTGPPGASETFRVRARHKDGTWRVIEGTVTDAGDDELLRGAVLRIRDITPFVTEQPLANDPFRSLAESVPSGILTADALGWVVFSNVAARQILDLPGEALRGRGWESVVDPEDRADVLTAAGAVLDASPGEQVTFRVRNALGMRWVHARFVPLRSDVPGSAPGEGPRMGWIATLDDITERRRSESQLAHRATHDPLTGLPNRTLLTDRLEQAEARRHRDGTDITVLFIDLDGFKQVNDEHGHKVGDLLLQEVARRLGQILREADTVARIGGDEFVAVCEATAAATGRELADRIEEAIAVPYLLDGCRCTVGASVGVACTGDVNDAEQLVLLADQDMYRRKRRA